MKSIIDQVIEKIFGITKVTLLRYTFTPVLNFDVSSGNDYYVKYITAACQINIIGAKDGDSGILELYMDTVGGYAITFGPMFTKRISDAFDATASKDNFVSWQMIGTDIIYSISQVQ